MESTNIWGTGKRHSEQLGGAARRIFRHRCGFRHCTLLASLGLILGFSLTLRGQGAYLHSPESTALTTDPAPELQSSPSVNAGDFSSKVKARFQAARKGTIVVVMPRTCKAGDTIEARVIVQRAPAGADGLLLNSATSKDGVAALVKADDEMAVELSADNASPIQINSQDPHPQLPLHRILPGGHSEWTWRIKTSQPGEQHLTVTSDVVYRRDFLSYDPPIIRFRSFSQSLPLLVLP